MSPSPARKFGARGQTRFFKIRGWHLRVEQTSVTRYRVLTSDGSVAAVLHRVGEGYVIEGRPHLTFASFANIAQYLTLTGIVDTDGRFTRPIHYPAPAESETTS